MPLYNLSSSPWCEMSDNPINWMKSADSILEEERKKFFPFSVLGCFYSKLRPCKEVKGNTLDSHIMS